MHLFGVLLELSKLLMYSQAEGEKNSSVFEELLLLCRFFTIVRLVASPSSSSCSYSLEVLN